MRPGPSWCDSAAALVGLESLSEVYNLLEKLKAGPVTHLNAENHSRKE